MLLELLLEYEITKPQLSSCPLEAILFSKYGYIHAKISWKRFFLQGCVISYERGHF